MNIGFIGCGKMAAKAAETLVYLNEKYTLYGCAATDYSRAEEFREQFSFKKAYKTYEELVNDKEIEIIYISTIISKHFEQIKLALNNNKHVLCEKAFCLNAVETNEVIALAKEKNLFLAEAIWTRYMPSRKIIEDLLKENTIGKPYLIEANLGYPIKRHERIREPEMGGGSLLDVGVYPLNFSLMFFGNNYKKINTEALMSIKGVDEINIINLVYGDKMALLHSTMNGFTSRSGYIYGENGYLEIQNINNPERINVYQKIASGSKSANENIFELAKSIKITNDFNGYEYEFIETYESIKKGLKENPSMPLSETLKVMKLCDKCRKKWKMTYPSEVN
ncbi:MAG TPA: Gfo/Idh/MocA family oxidoreductase [Candidatus Onthovivens sp.]|nr:Gfo/Idh/MocA family oxidoreductase [Candidatus Onthovivens sp.]